MMENLLSEIYSNKKKNEKNDENPNIDKLCVTLIDDW